MTIGNVETVSWRAIDDLRPLTAATSRADYHPKPDVIETFQRDGVVLLSGEFVEWVEPLRAGLERNLENSEQYAFPSESTTASEAGRFFDSYCNWQLIPEYLAFVLTSKAASMAAAFMGSNSAQLFHEHAFAKESGTQKATPWHQDLPYYCVDGSQTVSIYIALDDIAAASAVQFAIGSHLSGELHLPRAFADGSNYSTADHTMTPVPDLTDAPTLKSGLTSGDALLFSFRTLHGSTDSKINGRRRAFSTRWLGDDVSYCERPGETSPPLNDLGLKPGERMRDDWFPVLWPNNPTPKSC
ncbi:MAG: phytanoyl-CoA dioxygenase family protein [Acidimicrobiales bacterium]